MEDPRPLWNRVADSLLGRTGRIGSRRHPGANRALPLVAVGTVAILAARGWTPPTIDRHPPAAFGIDEVGATALPFEVNGQVEKWMRHFMTDQKDEFQLFLGREGTYEGLIRAKLQERSMPEDLLYLAMIESGFSVRARSAASDATGLWQFMDGTAKQYGLRVDEYVDERRDPVKATDAALDYLAALHERYGSWYLAAAAYNAGPARVDWALSLHRRRSNEDQDLYWDILDRLPNETREYVPKMLAATALAKQAERYGFEPSDAPPYEYDRVWVPGGTSLAAVAVRLGLPSARMRELNPQLLLGVTPPGSSFPLRVPKGSSDALIAKMGGRPTRSIAE